MALTRVTSGGIAPGVQITFDQNNNPTSPAITFEGAAGTGIYSPADKTLSFATDGKERMKIGPNGELTIGSLTNPVYIPVTDSAGAGGSNPNGKTIYVNINHSLADDSIENNGENLNRPFKTIERALIEAGRKSYVPGTGSAEGATGADKFEFFTIMVYPGQYEVDNRPGEFVGSFNSGSPADSYQGDYSSVLTEGSLSSSDFYKFNALEGGIILPRGTSLVGFDLRKTIIRPKYIPDANSGTEGAIFRLTGGCYVWQMTFKDGVAQPYYNKTQQYSDANRSHHKLVGFKYATVGDLASYYRKIDHIDANIPLSGTSVYELFQRIEENRIVGDSANASTIDTVSSASPYVFNCSIRSTWGMSGMHADGNDATGFRSMVVAQYTGISLQKDDRAFYLNGSTTTSIIDADSRHSDPLSTYRSTWRHYHIKSSNSSFIQVVSVFAVGFADHFLAESGGDLSITNSNSNFGNTSLRSRGFQDRIFTQNNKGRITAIIPPRGIDPDLLDNQIKVNAGFVSTSRTLDVTTSSQTSPNYNSNFKVLFIGQPITRSNIPEVLLNEGGTEKRYLVLGSNYQYTMCKKPNEKLYLELDGTTYQEPIRTAKTSNDPSYNLYNNDQRVGYGWVPATSGTVTDNTTGYLYILLTYSPNTTTFASGDNGILKKIFSQTITQSTQFVFQLNQDTGLNEQVETTVDVTDYTYFYGITAQPYIFRVDDNRGVTGGRDLLWRLEYTIPKTETNAKPPETRFVIYPYNYTNGQSGFNKSIFIYEVENHQQYISGVQDGIYYLTVMSGDVNQYTTAVNGQSTADFPVSQNINYLYPTINQDTPDWNPSPSDSRILVSGTGSSAISRDVSTNYIGTGAAYPYTSPDFYSITRECINDFISAFSISGIDTDTPYNNSTFDTNGKQLSVNDRKVNLGTPLQVSLKRSSVIRASGHTWEYMGFGPGNYSTSFPSLQTIVLDRYQIINAQGIEGQGGFVASTGTNSQGEFFIGNQVIKSGSDKTETLNVPRVKYSSETRLIDYTDLENQLTNSLINSTTANLSSQISNLQTQLSDRIAGLSENFVTNNLTVKSSFTSTGKTILGNDLIISNNKLNNDATLGFPVSSDTLYGFSKKTSDFKDFTDNTGFVTPSDLENWRIYRGIQTTTGIASELQYIYIQPIAQTQTVGTLTASATTITVDSTDGFDDSGVIEIEKVDGGVLTTEFIYYGSRTDTQFQNCTRGYKAVWQTSYSGVNSTEGAGIQFPEDSVVYKGERFGWEEPFVQNQNSPVEYKPLRRVSSYTGSVQSFIDNNYVPNPKSAKEFGVNLQNLQPVKRFAPFATISQAAEWASKNGFSSADTVYLVMQPGYYRWNASFNSRVDIRPGTRESVSNFGSYAGNDSKGNRSIFFFRTPSISIGHPSHFYVYTGISGNVNFVNGAYLQQFHILSTDDTIRRNGIRNSEFADASARNTARATAALGEGFQKYLRQILLNFKTSFEGATAATLQTAITAGETINTSNPKTISITRSFWFNPFNDGYGEGQAAGGIKIGNEVFDYEVVSFGNGTNVTIKLMNRAIEGTSAEDHSVGDDIKRYHWRAANTYGYVQSGNKWPPYYTLTGTNIAQNSMNNIIRCTGGNLFFNQVTLGSIEPTGITTSNLGGVSRTSGIVLQNCDLTIYSLVFRGNERWDIRDTLTNYNKIFYGFTSYIFTTIGNVNIRRFGNPNRIGTRANVSESDIFYGTASNYHYDEGIAIQPLVDPDGNPSNYYINMFGSSTIGDITTTATTITGGGNLRYWPGGPDGESMGSSVRYAYLNGSELISYTGITDLGSNQYRLDGVVRNIAFEDGSVWKGTAGTGGAWRSGTNLNMASASRIGKYWNKTEERWNYPLRGDEVGADDETDWKKRGCAIYNVMRMYKPSYFDFNDQYTLWASAKGWVGTFGNFASYSVSPRTALAFRFGFGLEWVNQYGGRNGIYVVEAAPGGWNGNIRVAGFGSPTLNANISDSDTTITLTGTLGTDLWNQYTNLKSGVIQIDQEVIFVSNSSYDSNNNVLTFSGCTRGWNRTVRASHTAGASISTPTTPYNGGRTIIYNPGLNIHMTRIDDGLDLIDNIESGAAGIYF